MLETLRRTRKCVRRGITTWEEYKTLQMYEILHNERALRLYRRITSR